MRTGIKEGELCLIREVAEKFFEACEAGKGLGGMREFCKADATSSAQAEPLADVKSLEGYTEWLKGRVTFLSDAGYELKSMATDEERHVCAYARGVRHR